ncbi:uracil-DNA glycosylase-like [Artemia franciscana]|uniref:Uracil-DNA glycosylase n=1 Tax=Artemia franciscana TaxID=6661 RepID=A0AA88I7D1_ARTSF|nr:hypothetical protein QYM36_003818 [Artemia franciscana]
MTRQARLTEFIKRSNSSSTVIRKTELAIKDDTSPLRKYSKLEVTEDTKIVSAKFSGLENHVGISWWQCLKTEVEKEYFKKLHDFVSKERKTKTIYPPEDQVFNWTKQCRLEEVRVVIIGQDPYHGPNQAHGLCFSVQNGVPPPPSLKNIFKELSSDIPGFKVPNHGNLSGWSKQGVLLLNACLTVRANQPNSHANNGWENLTDAVIKWISDNLDGVVFLLWGAYADKKAVIVNKEKHHLLKAPHPSPLSASRGFFGCKHFSKCNKLLEGNGKKPIDWNSLSEC